MHIVGVFLYVLYLVCFGTGPITPIFQNYFTGHHTVSKYQWSSTREYGSMYHMNSPRTGDVFTSKPKITKE